MNSQLTEALLLDTLATFAVAAFQIISATIVVGIAYLVFKFGWKRVITDKSLMLGSFYLRNVPYKGYNRFRSMEWNKKNTM